MKKQNGIGRLERIVFSLCKGVDTPRALKLYLLVKNKEWEQIARFKVHPTEYLHSDDFAIDYMITSFLRKTEGLPKVIDTRQAAIQQFKTAEASCKLTNERLKLFSRGLVSPTDSRVAQVIFLAQRKIGSMLSDFSESLMYEACSWGNGATSDLSRSRAYVDDKMTVLPFSCTPAAWKHAARVISSDLHWKEAIIARKPLASTPIIDGSTCNVFDTVPKTVLTDRCIAKEPRLNGFLQKGVGKYIRGHLRRNGIDLNDQSRNQMLAGMARTLGLATLDLEAASDTVAKGAVELLLPEPVYSYLDDIRSRETRIEGSVVQLEKFSSMGNAFTFELESLIFWSLASATSDILGWSTVGIYGDDIIVRKEVAPLLIEVLKFLGFSLNQEKSFITGDFYESCGKHFFKDVDVTPIFQKCVPDTDFEGLRLANRLLRFAYRLGRGDSLDRRIEPAWRCVVREFDLQRFSGPISLTGDEYLSTPRYFLRGAYDRNKGYRVLMLRESPKVIPADDTAMYALWLRLSHLREKCAPDSKIRYAERQLLLLTRGHGRGFGGYDAMQRILSLDDDSPGVEPGMIESRVVTKLRPVHGWVLPSMQSALDW